MNTENSKETEKVSADKSADEKFEDAVINDVIEKVPEEDRHEVKKMMTMSMQMGRVMSASPEMELMKKMTSQNIDTFLEGQKAEFKESRENKIFLGIVVLLFMIFIIVLVFLLGDKPDILEKVLYTIGGLIVGAFGGYGFGKTKRNDE